MEKIIETITHNGAIFEIVERPETVFAGKAYYAASKDGFQTDDEEMNKALDNVLSPRPFAGAIQAAVISVDFWKHNPEQIGLIFAKETETKSQPEGVDVFVMPASLFIRCYTDADAARLLKKETCAPWELFAFIRHEVMPKHGLAMADNGAQEIEYYDNAERSRGYAYIPVARIQGNKK